MAWADGPMPLNPRVVQGTPRHPLKPMSSSLPCSIVLRLLQWGVPYPLQQEKEAATKPAKPARRGVSFADEDDVAEAPPAVAFAPAHVTYADDDDDSEQEEEEDETVVPAVFGGQGSLHAWVSLSSPYTRKLVVAALRRRAASFAFLANDAQEPPTNADVVAAAAVAAQAGVSTTAVAAASSSAAELTAAWPIHLQFCEFERIDWTAGMSGKKQSSSSSAAAPPSLVCSYPVRKGLIRKAQLAFLVRKYCAKRPHSILHRTVPETHIMSVDDPEYLEEALNDVYEVRDMEEGKDMWIMKASMVNQAQGVHLIRSVADVERIVNEPAYEGMREWVMQRYIQRPLLLNDGCKFHVRAYVLAVGNLRVYLWSEMLALIAVEKYNLNHGGRNAHITNTCANEAHDDFVEEKHVRLLTEVLAPEVLKDVVEQMRATLSDLFSALHSEPTVFLAVPSAFELFGVDFLIDENHGVWFLEANAGPDLAMTGARLQPIVNGLIEHTFRLAVDPWAKQNAQAAEAAAAAAAVPEAAAGTADEDDVMQGSFLPCYDVVNATVMSMKYF